MKALTAVFLLLVAPCSALYGQAEQQPPEVRRIGTVFRSPVIAGWLVPREADIRNYEIGLDKAVKRGGEQSVSLKSISSDSSSPGFTILIQYLTTANYQNQRVRFSAFVRSEAAGRSNLFVRMDGDDMVIMNEDHMPNRWITGSVDWNEHQIVLDVPAGTRQLVLGIRLAGKGQIWVDDGKFEVVRSDVPLTGERSPDKIQEGSAAFVEKYKKSQPKAYERQMAAFLNRSKSVPNAPQNLDFEN